MRVDKRQLVLSGTPLGATNSEFTFDRLIGILNYLVENALLLGGMIAVGAVVYYGFLMSISKGDPTKFNDAKSALIKACIGAALIFGVYTVINTVQSASSVLTK